MMDNCVCRRRLRSQSGTEGDEGDSMVEGMMKVIVHGSSVFDVEYDDGDDRGECILLGIVFDYGLSL